MKKYIIVACLIVLLLFVWNYAYYHLGIYIDLRPEEPVTSFVRTEGKTIYMEREGEWEPFEIRGMDMGVGVPGEWATDFAIDKETYLRWFAWIQDMGVNTIRVYTILHDDFYNAFYEYNQGREEPLYLIHGVWVDDYVYNSHSDGYDEALLQTLIQDCRTVVDILHGQKSISLAYGGRGNGTYRQDVSQWVIGYIIGVEWEGSLVTYTNQNSEAKDSYSGTYLYTTQKADPFEAALCQVGDKLIEYESQRYKQQRLVAFSNWPTTDPFVYPAAMAAYRYKTACVDVEQIRSTDAVVSGMFASYHVYPYFPDYLELMRELSAYSDEEITERLGSTNRALLEYRLSLLEAPAIEEYLQPQDYYDAGGDYNTYLAYLRALNRYHTIPVVISEYGVTTGRGMAQVDQNTGRNQGHMSEEEQGEALIRCYEDIMAAGCAGSCLFSWQDEWFKRTWNTIYAVDLDNTPYWSDYQTNEQFFGLLTFDPGEEESVCYVDGDVSEWGEEDLVTSSGDMELSMKYDEKFIYFLVKKEELDQENDTIYIPVDTTQKTGSTYCENYDLTFDRACDFLMVIHGREDSRLLVQKRYEVLLSTYGRQYYATDPYLDPPDKDTPYFERIYLPLILVELLPEDPNVNIGVRYETGALRYGNANPESEEFDSLADFIFSGDYVEIRIPWELFNFSNPSEMMIHDDYYECYGIETLHIDEMYVGIASAENGGQRIRSAAFPLEGWGKTVTAHERLKESYYILRDYWQALDETG